MGLLRTGIPGMPRDDRKDGVPLSLPQCWARTIAVGSPQRPLPYYNSAGLRRRGHPAASSFFSERALPKWRSGKWGEKMSNS